MNSGQACRPCRGSCSLIPGRRYFGDLPGDEIVVSPPSPIVEPLGIRVLEMARAFTVMANYVSAVVFCRGHGSTAPRNARHRARTGKVGRNDSGHHAANVGDPDFGVLEVGCADALVLRRKSLENDVLELTVRRSFWRVSYVLRRSRRVSSSYRNSSGSWPGLIRAEFILACPTLSASFEQPLDVSRWATYARFPCPEPSSRVLPAKRRTTEHAAPFVMKNITLYKSTLAALQAASLEPSVSVAADGTGAPCRTRKATLS